MAESFRFDIIEDQAGRRLDDFLASRFGGLSRTRISNLIRAGLCLVNRHPAPPGRRLAAGDHVEFSPPGPAPTSMTPEPAPLDIIYEDDHILVLVKPVGVLVHPTRNVKGGTLTNALAYYLNRGFFGPLEAQSRATEDPPVGFEALDSSTAHARRFIPPPDGQAHSLTRPGLVHRLDRATSGLMVIAKTRAALSRLSSHFQRRLIEKRYTALVHGHFEPESGSIVAPIGRDENRQPHWWVTAGGKPAETRFCTLEATGSLSLVELEPVTGRTNQLRIHCAYAGHAIVGDDLYGRPELTLERLENNTQGEPAGEKSDAPRVGDASEPGAQTVRVRLCLHASRLAFHHPINGEWISFSSPIPGDMVGDRLQIIGDKLQT